MRPGISVKTNHSREEILDFTAPDTRQESKKLEAAVDLMASAAKLSFQRYSPNTTGKVQRCNHSSPSNFGTVVNVLLVEFGLLDSSAGNRLESTPQPCQCKLLVFLSDLLRGVCRIGNVHRIG